MKLTRENEEETWNTKPELSLRQKTFTERMIRRYQSIGDNTMIANLDPEALAMREGQIRGEKASMAVKFCLALLGNPSPASEGMTPEQMAEYTLRLAELLHTYVTGPQPGEQPRIVS